MMNGLKVIGLCIVGLLSIPSAAIAQSIVQLPSYNAFSYSGGVLVPDSGTAAFGSSGFNALNRSFMSGLGSGSLGRSSATTLGQGSLTATIIDQQEMDRQILGQTPVDMIRQHEHIEAQRNRDARGVKKFDRTEEGKELVRYARRLRDQGRYGASADAYRMAIASLDSPLRELAAAEMKRFNLK